VTNALFPLTPALSLREREHHLPVSLEPETPDTDDRRSTILPLPEGEGRGEGERRIRIAKPVKK